MAETVLILGASSAIGKALACEMATRGCRLILAARRIDELQQTAVALRSRYAIPVDVLPFDALNFAEHPAFFERCVKLAQDQRGGELDGVVLCHGYLPDQVRTQTDFDEARRTLDINYTSAISLLSPAAEFFERRQRGYIAAISSVGGDRALWRNYNYAAAKAALSAWLQGLRNRLWKSGVHVLTIKPGFVESPMTATMTPLYKRIMVTPQRAARDIDRAIRRRKNVLYTPWFWRPIFWVINSLPEAIFMRTRL